jgi:hypothetical protein
VSGDVVPRKKPARRETRDKKRVVILIR